MNLGVFLKGLLSTFTGGVSNLFEGDNLGNLLNNAGSTATDLGNQNMAGNIVAKYTGSRLTDAEREANSFNSLEAQKQRDFEQSMFNQQTALANTAYQRQVADMQAAGVNPMMAVSGSGGSAVPSAASGSAASSVSPSGASLNLGTLLQLALDYKLLPAKLANLAADTAKKNADASSVEQQVTFFDRIKDFREEGERLANEMSRSQMKSIEQNINESVSRVNKNIAETKSEEEKLNLYVSQRILNEVTADNIQQMRPFIQAELVARTAHERQAAKVAAVEEAFKLKMLNSGSIEAAIRLDNAHASDMEVQAKMHEFEQSIRDGSLRKAADSLGDWRTGVVAGLYTGLNNAAKSVLGKW